MIYILCQVQLLVCYKTFLVFLLTDFQISPGRLQSPSYNLYGLSTCLISATLSREGSDVNKLEMCRRNVSVGLTDSTFQ